VYKKEAGVPGPYASEQETHTDLIPDAVARLHRAGRVRPGDPDHEVRDTVLWHLTRACTSAGVELGVYDRRILTWLAGCEPSTVQVIADVIARAHAAGRAGNEGQQPAPTPGLPPLAAGLVRQRSPLASRRIPGSPAADGSGPT
jgi:hypothetical protein